MRTFILKVIFLIKASAKRYWRKFSPIKSARGTHTGWLCENTVGLTNGYLDWLADGKVSGKNILQVMGPLSRLEVPAHTFATLIEQTTLLLGQASLSVSYTHRLNILKTLLKGSCRTKALLREKTALLQDSKGHLFGKNFVHT